MQKSFKTPPPAAHRGMGQNRTSTDIMPKFPAYGKALADRQQFNNLPALVVVCVGGNCWNRAKRWQQHTNIEALVLLPDSTPSALQWPVNNCLCLVE